MAAIDLNNYSINVTAPYAGVGRGYTRGDMSPQQQRWTGRYSPTTGWTEDQEFLGLSEAQMQSLATYYYNEGVEYELTLSKGISTLKTTDTRGNQTIDTWEINVNQTQISCFKNPRNIAAFNAADGGTAVIGASVLAFLAWWYEKGIGNKTEIEALAEFNSDQTYLDLYGFEISPGVKAIYTPDAGTEMRALFDRLRERLVVFKSDTTFYDIYTLRHTTNVSNRYLYNIADENKNCIYTPAQLYAEVQNSSYWLFPMPDAFINVLESNPPPDGPTGSFANNGFYLWGFLKGGSSRQTTANNRTNIVTEYKQFLWSIDEYATI